MLKPIFSKVMWIGKATTFIVGLAVVLALTLAIVASAAEAAKAKSLKLGIQNTVSAVTTMLGSLAGPILSLDNNGTGPALDLQVEPGSAPMTVNSETKVTNLNADKLDGRDFSQMIGVNGAEQVADTSPMDSSSPKTVNATCPEGKTPIAGGARLQGSYTNIALNESHRNFADSRKWQTSAHEVNPTTEVWLLETYAICVLAGGS